MMLVVTGVAAAGRADVYEIDDRGSVHVRHVAGEVQWIAPGADPEPAGNALAPAMLVPDALVPEAALTLMTPPKVPDVWLASLQTAAQRYALSPDLLAALVWQESRWHPAALSPKGARGLAQLMPATAHALAVDASDPAANLAGGAQYLRQMLDLFDGDVERALAAYNAGPGRVQRANGLPRIAETQSYVSNILLRLTPADAGQTGLPK